MSTIGSTDSPLAPRLAGVRVARDGAADSDKGKPNTVISVEGCTLKFVHFFDEKGNPGSALFFVTESGQYLSTADTTQWCRSLKPMSEWMRKGVDSTLTRARRSQTPVEVPQQDSVDVIGTGEQTTEVSET